MEERLNEVKEDGKGIKVGIWINRRKDGLKGWP